MPRKKLVVNYPGARTIRTTRTNLAIGGMLKRYWKRRRKPRIYRQPKPGGNAIIFPLKCSYMSSVSGSGTGKIDLDLDITLGNLPNPDWFNRYYPLFQLVRINKVRVKIICPYNIGQAQVGRGTLYKCWSKKATTLTELPPTSETEWLNLPNAKQKIFNSRSNSLEYFYTPYFEAPQGATVAKRLMYKQWFEMPNGPTQCVDHGGIIASIMAVSGANIETTEKFTIQTTLYCQFKGLKQL